MRAPSLTNGFKNLNQIPSLPSESKPLPSAYLDLGFISSHQTSSKPRKKSRSEKLESRYKSQEKLVKLHFEIGEKKIAESMSRCGQKFDALTCGGHIVAKLPNHRCNIRYCSLCASRRAGRYRNKYLPYAQEFIRQSNVPLTPCLLTLTQTKIKSEKLIDSRDRILKSFNRFIRHEFFDDYFAGGIYAIENTVSEDANHTHLHLVVFRKRFISEKLLKEHWAMVSPGAKNLNIKRIDNLELGLREVIKYISKPIDVYKFERRHLIELLEIKGKRMISTFGNFRRFCLKNKLPKAEKEEREKLAEGQSCSHCNEELFQLTMTSKELIAFYRFIEQSDRGSPPINSALKPCYNRFDSH